MSDISLREKWQAPRLLIGHSLGGLAALVAAANIPEVRAVATLAAWSKRYIEWSPGEIRSGRVTQM